MLLNCKSIIGIAGQDTVTIYSKAREVKLGEPPINSEPQMLACELISSSKSKYFLLPKGKKHTSFLLILSVFVTEFLYQPAFFKLNTNKQIGAEQ